MEKERTYIAIDLKSFYASIECVERGLDPLTTNLVVADVSRTEKTICLAVSPSLKARGISSRPRLFEVIQSLGQINRERKYQSGNHFLTGKSCSDTELQAHPDWEVDYIAASPRMALYIQYSTRIYQIYLKYISSEDIHVYSIDEVFIDATDYLSLYGMTAHELAMTMVRDVLSQTGITATAGIGTNLYLCKVAMDIVAKHIPADADGVRIAELDEMSYRRQLWNHQPLTDFWRVGRGTSRRLEMSGIKTMGQLARMSVRNEEALYKMFGINAELLIDHAWGWEPCTMKYIKTYKTASHSLSSGQVLKTGYDFEKARVVALEMADSLALDLVEKRLVTDQVILMVGYDKSVSGHGHGSANLGGYYSSSTRIVGAIGDIFDRVVDRKLPIRRLNVTANHVIPESAEPEKAPLQLDLFSDSGEILEKEDREKKLLDRERALQETLLGIKRKYGRNSILKGRDFEEGATAIERNQQIGGHKA